jgi:hypothetical protein
MIRPGDILCVTNLGNDGMYGVPVEAADRLKEDTGCRRVYFFSDDVDFTIIRKDMLGE